MWSLAATTRYSTSSWAGTSRRPMARNPQAVLTVPLLEGTDGVNKMSKTYGNFVGIDEPPDVIFGKLMSISDELMLRYYELFSDISIEELQRAEGWHEEGERPPDGREDAVCP